MTALMSRISAVLIRRWAWWYNKVPLSFTLVLLLLDGRRFSPSAFAVLAFVVLSVCAVANYGYALNDLFDVEEDRRAGRENAAVALGTGRTWAIVASSAVCAEIAAVAAGGVRGAALTLMALALPAAYSIPPLRIKERRWLGVAADALAAHVYPALLAVAAVVQWSVRPVTGLLVVFVAVWSLAAGVRGILSHQLHTAERDASAGLRTVVHDLGSRRLERCIVAGLLPLELTAFGGLLLACDLGAVARIGIGVFLVFEAYRTLSGRFRVVTFNPQGQPYIPFVEERFYKAWGPIVFALDAARSDPWYLVVAAAYAVLFRAQLRQEWDRVRAVTDAMRPRRATGPGARSSGES